MSELPVSEMVLYKHGVGFFVREGQMTADEVTLTFRETEINDVLKSLAVFDRGGGRVLGIRYQTPMDEAARLADSSIRLSDTGSMRDLLTDLRGRGVVLTFDDEVVSGRLVGIDEVTKEGIDQSLVSIVGEDDGEVRVFPFQGLRGVGVIDERARQDLHFFLDTSTREDVRRTLTLQLSPGQHDLVAYYVAPSPTWRVSYRFVAESDEGGQSGKGLLLGWGLFDNRLDEDLTDVAVTLVAGQPISFIYDLYASRIPQRPLVEDEARVAPGPVEFLTAAAEAEPAEERIMGIRRDMEESLWPGGRLVKKSVGLAADAPAPADIADTTRAQAEGREAGEFFQYVVTSPVSVKRGESALVPIISADVAYSREVLYNEEKLPGHPVAALRFKNTTGLTLERGPVTLVEDGNYKGEAVTPFTKADYEVYLAYAVELGVRVTREVRETVEVAGLRIGMPSRFDRPKGRMAEGYLVIDEYYTYTYIYKLENTGSDDVTVTLEQTISKGHELFDTPEPRSTTSSEWRWYLPVRARDASEFVVKTRRLVTRREHLQKLNARHLQRYMADRWLDEATLNRLNGLLRDLALVDDANAEQEKLAEERTEINKRQEQLRKNLTALRGEGEEAALRSRMLGQLEAAEDRLEAIEARVAELEELIDETSKRFNETLAGLDREGQDVVGER